MREEGNTWDNTNGSEWRSNPPRGTPDTYVLTDEGGSIN